MSRFTLFGLMFVGAAAPVAAQRPATLGPEVRPFVTVDAPVVALTHVRVIDGTGAPAAEDQTIVIRDGRIAAVGPFARVTVPGGAKVLELTGRTVTPGMIGLHDHTFYTTPQRTVQSNFSAPRLYLASGVTTVRTTGAISPYSEINVRRSIEAGTVPGPRMYVTGPYLTGPGGDHAEETVISTEAEARRVVAYWAEEGVQWMKFYTGVSRAAMKAAIDEGHRHGIKLTGHLCSVSYREAVALGIDALEHGLLANSDYDKARKPDQCDPAMMNSFMTLDVEGPEAQATFRDMVSHHVSMTSTLAVFELFVPDRPAPEQRALDAMSPETRSEYLASHDQIAKGNGMPGKIFTTAMAYERAFVRAGGLLGFGVDPTGNGGALFGFGDQRNLELLVEAGFTPMEAFRIATLNGAKILGIADQLGSIEAGKRADLVVVAGNPAANVGEVRKVETVFKDGVGYDSAKLIESVKGQIGIR